MGAPKILNTHLPMDVSDLSNRSATPNFSEVDLFLIYLYLFVFIVCVCVCMRARVWRGRSVCKGFELIDCDVQARSPLPLFA